MKQIGSVTTGALSQASEGASATGLQPGATGSGALPATASERLMESEPKAVDQTLEASLKQHVATSLVPDRVSCTDAHGYDERLRGYRVRGDLADAESLQEALMAYERACLPAPDDRIVQELTKLRMKTAAKATDTETLELQQAVYAEELAEYPADVVLYVLRTQPKISKWWPAWGELAERLDLYAKDRMKRRDALRRALARA